MTTTLPSKTLLLKRRRRGGKLSPEAVLRDLFEDLPPDASRQHAPPDMKTGISAARDILLSRGFDLTPIELEVGKKYRVGKRQYLYFTGTVPGRCIGKRHYMFRDAGGSKYAFDLFEVANFPGGRDEQKRREE